MMIKGTGFDVNFFNITPAKGKDSVQGKSADTKTARTFSEALRGKTDTIEISERTEDNSSLLNDVKKKIMGDINRDTDTDSLERLKRQITDGKYTVDTDELAQILSR